MVRLALISRFTNLGRRLLAQLIFKISRWLIVDDQLSTEKDVDKVTGSSISATLILSLHAQFTVRLARN